ncbi:MAG: hypothetical protein AAFP76_14655 [Bacteroidota bacterium]
MNNERLYTVLSTLVDEIEGNSGQWQFTIEGVQFIVLTDELHNRMRIISPIAKASDLTEQDLKRCMQANFHSALDVKYSISDELLWVAFLHPFKELVARQVEDAVQQVYSAVQTYGDTYSSSNLYFPTHEDRKKNLN